MSSPEPSIPTNEQRSSGGTSGTSDQEQHGPRELINTGAKGDGCSPVWDMSQERQFMETLMNQRFNFFVAFVGLILVAAVNSHDDTYFKVILWIGFIFAALLSYSILRSFVKLNTAFEYLKNLGEKHPMAHVDSKHNKGQKMKWPFAKWRAKHLIGWVIPFASTALLGISALFVSLGVFHPPHSSEKARMDAISVTADKLWERTATNAQLTAGIEGRFSDISREVERLRAIESELKNINAKLNLISTNTADIEALRSDLQKLRAAKN